MDVVEIPQYAINLLQTFQGGGASPANVLLMTNKTTGSGAGVQVDFDTSVLYTLPVQPNPDNTVFNGLVALDMDWDGDKDIWAFTGAAGSRYIQNDARVAHGSSLHFRIVDGEGINSLFGNTVQLFDAAGKLVATQTINPQAGNQTNDSSAIVDFYGLNPDESYSLALYKSVNGVSNDVGGLALAGGNAIENVSAAWSGFKAGAANSAYVLTTEKDGEVHNADIGNGIVGTGYNDTFFATLGSDSYEGGGGTQPSSSSLSWTSTGGMDVIDYKLAGESAVTVDLSQSGMQATGYGSAALSNIEGVAGAGGNDVLTDGAGANLLNGRGGNDVLNLTHGGHDTLLYQSLSATDATGGNGADRVTGFTAGQYESTASADRIDVSQLLIGFQAGSSDIADYLSATQEGGNTVISIDRDGAGTQFTAAQLLTLEGVSTSIQTLSANHQLVTGGFANAGSAEASADLAAMLQDTSLHAQMGS
jgi:hypothetical protein